MAEGAQQEFELIGKFSTADVEAGIDRIQAKMRELATQANEGQQFAAGEGIAQARAEIDQLAAYTRTRLGPAVAQSFDFAKLRQQVESPITQAGFRGAPAAYGFQRQSFIGGTGSFDKSQLEAGYQAAQEIITSQRLRAAIIGEGNVVLTGEERLLEQGRDATEQRNVAILKSIYAEKANAENAEVNAKLAAESVRLRSLRVAREKALAEQALVDEVNVREGVLVAASNVKTRQQVLLPASGTPGAGLPGGPSLVAGIPANTGATAELDALNANLARLSVTAREAAAATQAAAAAEAQQARAATAATGPTFFQRVQARLLPGNRDPSSLSTFPQLLGREATRLGSYALTGAVLFGAIQGIRTVITEANKLEQTFVIIKNQFDSLGQPQNFQRFRTEILGIARDTGEAADVVANIGFQLQGAFGGNTQKAIDETRAAFEAVKVTGLNINEVIDAFTALTQNFTAQAVSISQVSDKALGLQERFGVLAKQIISFSADLAPVASQVGFTVQKLEALGAVAQKYSGRSGTSLAEAFGRIFPAIQNNAAKFYAFFEGVPAVQNDLEGIAQSLRTGNISAFFETLLKDYSKLDEAQKNQLISLLGGRREAAALIPVLEHANEVLGEFAGKNNDAGKTARYFADQQNTLSQTLARLGESLTQAGIALFNSGIKDFLIDLLSLLNKVVGAIAFMASALGSLNSGLQSVGVSGGGVKVLLEGLALYGGLKVLSGGFGAARAASGGGGGALNTGVAFGAGALGSFKGIGARYTAGFAQAVDAEILAGGGVASVFSKSAAGVAGGLKGAFAGFPWGAIGLTIGALAAQQVYNNIHTGAQAKTDKLFGPNNEHIDDPGVQQQVLQQLNIAGNYLSPEDVLQGKSPVKVNSFEEIRKQAALQKLTLKQLRERLENSGYQSLDLGGQLASNTPGNWSEEDLKNQAAAGKIVGQIGQQGQDVINRLLGDPELLKQLADIKTHGTYTKDPAQLTGLANQLKTYYEGLAQRIRDNTASVTDIEGLLHGPEADQIAGALYAQYQVANAQAQQANSLQDEALSAQEALDRYASGDLSYSKTKTALVKTVDIDKILGFATGSSDQRKKLAEDAKKLSTFESDFALAAVEEANKLRSALTPGAAAQANVDALRNVLNTPGLSRDAQKKATDDLLGAMQALFSFKQGQAITIEEQIALLQNGIPVPPELQISLIEQQLETTNIAYQAFVLAAVSNLPAVADEISKRTAQIMVTMGVTLGTASKAALLELRGKLQAEKDLIVSSGVFFDGINQAFATLNSELAAIDQAVAAIDANTASLGTVTTSGNFGADPNAAAQKTRQNNQAVANAQLDVQAAQANGDAIALADIARQRAEIDLKYNDGTASRLAAEAKMIEADHQRVAAEQAKNDALRDLANAQSGDDPITVAKNAIASANEAAANASGPEAQAKAAAAQIRAGFGLAEAMQKLVDSQIDILIAMANSADNTVEAAKLGLQKLRDRLAHANELGLSGDEQNSLKSQIIDQEAAVRRAQISEGEQQIRTSLDLGRINKQQAIAQLQALLQFARTQKEIDQINLEIKNLKGQLGQDFKFNLPTVLGLPTLYEARRIGQAGASGSSYQDNRTINITLNANTNASPVDIAAAVASVMGPPQAFGITGRRY